MKYTISQAFSILVAAVLVFTFYLLIMATAATGQNFLTELLLIVMAIIMLAIFSSVSKIEEKIGRKK